MNNFKDFGVKIRRDFKKNYYSIWYDLKTYRLDLGPDTMLNPERSEFYDIGITERCNAMCDFCYVSADSSKQDYPEICKTWKSWMNTFQEDQELDWEKDQVLKELIVPPEKNGTVDELFLFLLFKKIKEGKIRACYTDKPFQGAIGSVGEGTLHPEFPEFLKTMYETGVIPNYTTNGIILSDYSSQKCKDILEATRKYCGGVAVSFGNKSLRDKASKAIENLVEYGECKIMIHELISDKESVNDFIKRQKEYSGKIHYHVLLPLMKYGRSSEGMSEETYLYLTDKIREEGIRNVAFGANFASFMMNHPGRVDIWEYPKDTYSKNILLKDRSIIITPSSFNLKPIMKI